MRGLEDDVPIGQNRRPPPFLHPRDDVERVRVKPVGEGIVDQEMRDGEDTQVEGKGGAVALQGAEIVGIAQPGAQLFKQRPAKATGVPGAPPPGPGGPGGPRSRGHCRATCCPRRKGRPHRPGVASHPDVNRPGPPGNPSAQIEGNRPGNVTAGWKRRPDRQDLPGGAPGQSGTESQGRRLARAGGGQDGRVEAGVARERPARLVEQFDRQRSGGRSVRVDLQHPPGGGGRDRTGDGNPRLAGLPRARR